MISFHDMTRFFGILIVRMRRKDGGGNDCLDRVHEVPAKFAGIRSGDGRANLMNKTRMAYFEKDDVLHLAISDEPEAGSVEVSPNITAELNAKGELIGIEILSASTFIRDFVLESVQAKVLDLAAAKTA